MLKKPSTRNDLYATDALLFFLFAAVQCRCVCVCLPASCEELRKRSKQIEIDMFSLSPSLLVSFCLLLLQVAFSLSSSSSLSLSSRAEEPSLLGAFRSSGRYKSLPSSTSTSSTTRLDSTREKEKASIEDDSFHIEQFDKKKERSLAPRAQKEQEEALLLR